MLNHTLPLLYKGYKIRKENGSLCIFYPDGLKSAAAPGSTDAAKRMVDKHIDSTYSIYDESGFKDANVIEPVAVVSKPEAVYSNKNWAA